MFLGNSFLISEEAGNTGYIQTPYFPEMYPKDYSAEYIFIGINQTNKVLLSFEDFDISPWSYVEVSITIKTILREKTLLLKL